MDKERSRISGAEGHDGEPTNTKVAVFDLRKHYEPSVANFAE
jgi:hypothetical protein